MDAKEMKVLHAVLICLMIFAIFSYTAVTLEPLIQQDNNLVPKEKTASRNSLDVSPKEKPGPIRLMEAIDDPTPH